MSMKTLAKKIQTLSPAYLLCGALCCPTHAQAEVSVRYSRMIEVEGGLGGESSDRVYSDMCSPGYRRANYKVRKVAGSGGHCEGEWVSDDPHDCQVRVHFGVSSFKRLVCQIVVHEQSE